MGEPTLTVDRVGGGFIGWCSVHGTLRYAWARPYMAALDLLGHAAAHHPREGVPSSA